MIRSFKDRDTEMIFSGKRSKRFPNDIHKRALTKLLMLDAAESELDLRSPPENHLEKLKGDRRSEFSIRINRQWRICFRFENGNAYDVGNEDYH